MAVKIRLQRRGRKKRPFYHIVVADERAPRDGRFIEKLGTYNPMTKPATIDIDSERAFDWLMKGAQPTDTARAILRFKGLLYKKHLQRGVSKGALTQEQADELYGQWVTDKENKIRDRVNETAAEKARWYEELSGTAKPIVVKEEAVAEEVETGDAAAEEAAGEEPAAEEAATEEPVAEAAATEEPAAEEAATEEPAAEEAATEEPAAEEAATEEPAAEEAATEEPAAEEAATEEPAAEEAATEEPAAEEAATEEPAAEEAATEEPAAEEAATEEPAAEEAATEEPAAEEAKEDNEEGADSEEKE